MGKRIEDDVRSILIPRVKARLQRAGDKLADLIGDDYLLYVNPTGGIRHRRPARRHGRHGAQGHRRHLRRPGCPRRRSLLGQRRLEGGPLGSLCGPPHRQEHGGSRHRRPDTRPTLLRDRHRTSAQHLCGYLRHGPRIGHRCRDSPPHRTAFRPASRLHRGTVRSQEPHLRSDGLLRSLRQPPPTAGRSPCSTMAGRSRKKSNSSGGKSWTRWRTCAANSAYCKHRPAMPTADTPRHLRL